MFPCADPEQYLQIDGPRRKLGVASGVAAHGACFQTFLGACVFVAGLVRQGVTGVGVQVAALGAEVRAWVGGAGDVGGEDGELAVGVSVGGFDEPNEAGAEHGVGGGEEGGAEGGDG